MMVMIVLSLQSPCGGSITNTDGGSALIIQAGSRKRIDVICTVAERTSKRAAEERLYLPVSLAKLTDRASTTTTTNRTRRIRTQYAT